MKLRLTLFIFALLPFISFGQGCITIFSDDGDRFYLILNGIRQNNQPQTNIRVDGLINEFYSAKIIFENKALKEISKNIPTKDAGTNDFAEMTYRIKRGKNGEMKLRYFSATPIPPSYVPPADMFYTHCLTAPGPGGSAINGGNVASGSINAAGVDMSFGVNEDPNGNVNMNVNVGGQQYQVRTNTNGAQVQTNQQYSQQTNQQTSYNTSPARTGCNYAMDQSTFASALKTIKGSSFDDTKLSTAKSILSNNCVNTNQVVEMCKQFSFEENKLEFAKFAYGRTVDPNNYFKVVDVFTFDSNKTELNEYISH